MVSKGRVWYDGRMKEGYNKGVMLERDFQRRLINRFKEFGWELLKIHGHAMQTAGWPDMFVCGVGLGPGVWIELKTDNGTVSERQKIVIDRMRMRGVATLVLRPRDCSGVVWTESGRVVGEYLHELARQQRDAT